MGVKNFKKYTALIVFMFISLNHMNAQNGSDEDSNSNLVTNLGLENLQSVSQVQVLDMETLDNSIYIEQIGSNNFALANFRVQNKELDLIQNGNANTARFNITAKTTKHSILQNGDNNYFLEYGNTPSLNLERTIIQDGNNHGVVIFGNNSLTDKIMLNQKGGSKTITIRNFN